MLPLRAEFRSRGRTSAYVIVATRRFSLNDATRVPRPWVLRPRPSGAGPVSGSPVAAPPAGAATAAQASLPFAVLFAVPGAALVFMRFSMLPEIQSTVFGFNLYLLYLAAIPACFAIIVSGGLKRTFRGLPGYCWLGYMMWIALATPFSSWRGDSAHLVSDYLRTSLPMLFVIAGLAINWRLVKWMMYAIAAGGVVNLIAARLFMRDYAGRLGLSLLTVGNPNDFAAHLLLVLPFLLWIALSRRAFPMRLAALAGVAFGVYLMFATASRGALVAAGVDVIFFLWMGSAKQRIALLVSGPILVVAVVASTPQTVLSRLQSFSANDSTAEALESSESRQYLLKKAIQYSLEFPLFGVGPGQFSNYEGMHNQVIGTHGSFHDTHNSFMQASAECGIPALLFCLGGVFFTYRLLLSAHKQASRVPALNEFKPATFCILLGLTGFCTAIFFLNFAYTYYLPAMGGLAIAVHEAMKQELAKAATATGDTRVDVGGPPVRRWGVQPRGRIGFNPSTTS
jgi:O-antigen ligase